MIDVGEHIVYSLPAVPLGTTLLAFVIRSRRVALPVPWFS